MALVRKFLASQAVASLTSPRTIDHYLTQIHPLLTVHEVRGRVVGVERETDHATTVTIKPNGVWRGFRPGQHVQFGIEVDGTRKVRCFSVSSSTQRTDGLFTVSIKVHPDGYVSRFVNNALRPGTLVHLSQADGEFVLPAKVPDHIALISGGSGITPVMSMLRSLRDTGHTGRVTFLHYARSPEDEMFGAELDAISRDFESLMVKRIYTRAPEHNRDLHGRFTVDHLHALGIEPASTPSWACGPAGLIESVQKAYANRGGTQNLAVEYFKVPSINLDAGEAVGTVKFESSQINAQNDGRTILEQAEAAGLKPEFGCRMGVCSTCTVQKQHGAVRHVISGQISADTNEPVKICVNVPIGDTCFSL